jgi:LAS superfamily LD-carboxypeptidase LdcB
MAENLDPEVISRLNEAYRNQYESLKDTNLLAAAQLEAEKSKIKLNDSAKIAYQGTIDSLKSFTKALTNQEVGFQKYTEVGKQLASTVADAAKQMGGVAGAMGSVLKIATEIANAMAIQADAIVKSKDQIAKFGAVGGLTSEKLLDLAHKAGYFSLNMSKLYTAAGKAGGDLLVFSKNMSEGVQKFTEMAAVTDEVREQFNNLGVAPEELTDFIADYVKSLGATGVQLSSYQKTVAALQKSSLDYTKNILELSNLTGKDVETVKQKQREAQSSLDFMISQNKLQQRINELRNSKDADSLKEADALEAEFKKRQAIATLATIQLSSEQAAAVRNIIATNGVITETSSSLAAGNVQFNKIMGLTREQGLTDAQAAARVMDLVLDGVNESSRLYQTSISLLGPNGDLGRQVLLSTESLQALQRRNNMTMAEREAEARKLIDNPEVDELKKNQNAVIRAEIKTRADLDDKLKGINPFVVKPEDVARNFKELLEKFWGGFKEYVLMPMNNLSKEYLGVDLKPVIESVVAVFKQLATEAKKLYDYFGGINGFLNYPEKKIEELRNAENPGIRGMAQIFLGYPKTNQTAPTGATSGGANAPSMGSATRGPASDFGAFDFGAGDDWGGEPKSRSMGRGSLKGNTSGLDPELQKRLMAASEVYGKPLTITSGYRTSAEQKKLYEDYKAGRSRFPAAPPGSSLHQEGRAVDLAEYRDPAAVRALASVGVLQTVKNDEPHFTIAGPKTEAASGSSSASGTSVQSSAPTTTAMSSSDDTLIRVMLDMRNTINTKMQEMVDKVAESNGILEKIMRRS